MTILLYKSDIEFVPLNSTTLNWNQRVLFTINGEIDIKSISPLLVPMFANSHTLVYQTDRPRLTIIFQNFMYPFVPYYSTRLIIFGKKQEFTQ